jgi:hypothetical protein
MVLGGREHTIVRILNPANLSSPATSSLFGFLYHKLMVGAKTEQIVSARRPDIERLNEEQVSESTLLRYKI